MTSNSRATRAPDSDVSGKLNGLDPEAYLADVIDRMAKGHPINRLSDLLPWNWKKPEIKLAA